MSIRATPASHRERRRYAAPQAGGRLENSSRPGSCASARERVTLMPVPAGAPGKRKVHRISFEFVGSFKLAFSQSGDVTIALRRSDVAFQTARDESGRGSLPLEFEPVRIAPCHRSYSSETSREKSNDGRGGWPAEIPRRSSSVQVYSKASRRSGQRPSRSPVRIDLASAEASSRLPSSARIRHRAFAASNA